MLGERIQLGKLTWRFFLGGVTNKQNVTSIKIKDDEMTLEEVENMVQVWRTTDEKRYRKLEGDSREIYIEQHLLKEDLRK